MKLYRLAEHILDAPRPESGKIRLACEHCGVWADVLRDEFDPPTAVVMLTNECPRCNAAAGGFGTSEYFDADSNEVALTELERADTVPPGEVL
jgi:hypothetical protein